MGVEKRPEILPETYGPAQIGRETPTGGRIAPAARRIATARAYSTRRSSCAVSAAVTRASVS